MKLILNLEAVWIHSVYLQPLGNYRNTEYKYLFELLRTVLSEDSEYIVVDDFNLYYLL
jgi:hypothetical protein